MNWTVLNRKYDKFTRKYKRVFVKALYDQVYPLITSLRANNNPELTLNQIDSLISEDPIRDAFIKLYRDVVKNFGVQPNIARKDLLDDIWEETGIRFAVTKGSKRIVTITGASKEYMRNFIKEQIAKGVDAGLSYQQIAAKIEKGIPNYLKTNLFRAERIAMTEVHTAANYASYENARELGGMQKRWLTAPIGLAKNDRHALTDLNEQVRMPDEPFNVNGEDMMYPGDVSGSAENVINCRCTVYFEPMGWEG